MNGAEHSSFLVHPSSFRVAVVTPDVVGPRMAGPGIRATYLARELGKHFPTTLVAHGSTDARRVIREASVLIGQPAHPPRRGVDASHVRPAARRPPDVSRGEAAGVLPATAEQRHPMDPGAVR